MNIEDFENKVVEALIHTDDQTFTVYTKGAKIIAESYEIDTDSDDIVYLYHCNWIIASVNIQEITDVR